MNFTTCDRTRIFSVVENPHARDAKIENNIPAISSTDLERPLDTAPISKDQIEDLIGKMVMVPDINEPGRVGLISQKYSQALVFYGNEPEDLRWVPFFELQLDNPGLLANFSFSNPE